MDRHRRLLDYLKRLVPKVCPPYLHNDRDDIIQTVLIRLDDKLVQLAGQLERCCSRLREEGRAAGPEIAASLEQCRAEIAKAWDRDRSKKLVRRLERVLAWARDGGADETLHRTLRDLEKCLAEIRKIGGKEAYSTVYIKRGVHWAILDTKKKYGRQSAEFSPEEREDGTSDWDFVRDGSVPGPRAMFLREEISKCLRRLVRIKRRPTVLALLGYEYSEIARFLDLSLPQADSRIRRGKEFLRRCLNLKGVSP